MRIFKKSSCFSESTGYDEPDAMVTRRASSTACGCFTLTRLSWPASYQYMRPPRRLYYRCCGGQCVAT